VAMDGVRILGTDGAGHEVKVGVVVPVHGTADGERRERASYAAGLEPAAAFGRRLALEAHRRGLEGAARVAVLGDGAEWIWQLAAEHCPHATQIVDWFHASERVWALGRALWGEGTAATTAWVEAQVARLAHGEAATLAQEWQRLPCRGQTATVRDAQVTYFTNQAPRMAYDRYRAAGWDIGSGMVESACKHLIGAREKGPGMRWSEAGAHTVAAVRVLLFNDHWASYDLAA
jgi:DNA segregation ATPase FtsK/SpoIIIE-like protein